MTYQSGESIANLHNSSATLVKEYAANQTAATLLTPTTGKRLKITGVTVSTAATSGEVYIYFAGSNISVARFTATANSNQFLLDDVTIVGNTNESLRITSTTSTANVAIWISYDETTEATELTTTTSTSTSTTTTSTSTTTT